MKAGAAITIALLLGACTVGPSYRGPPSGVASRPSAQGAFAGRSSLGVREDDLPDHWWMLYEDARLNGLVIRALAANQSLLAAEANMRGAAAVVEQAKGARLPTTTLAGGAAYAKDGIPTPSRSEFVYSVAGSLTYPVDLFGGIRRGIEAAEYGSEAAIAARDATRVVVAAAVTRAYTAACSANRSYAAAEFVLETQKRTLETTQRLFNGGRATAFDVTRARTAVDQSAALLPGFLSGRQTALFQVGALLGGPPQDYPKDLERCEAPPTLTQPIPIGDGAALLRRRPDIREAERRLAAATATIGVSVAKLYPQITLGGAASSTAPFSLAGTENSLGFSIGPLVTWQFPNLVLVRAEIAQAGAAADQAAAQFEATIIAALQQTETALAVYARQIESVAALERASADAGEANTQAHRLYLFGRTDFINVLTSEAALATANESLSQSQAQLVEDQVALFQALGGGWQSESARDARAHDLVRHDVAPPFRGR